MLERYSCGVRPTDFLNRRMKYDWSVGRYFGGEVEHVEDVALVLEALVHVYIIMYEVARTLVATEGSAAWLLHRKARQWRSDRICQVSQHSFWNLVEENAKKARFSLHFPCFFRTFADKL